MGSPMIVNSGQQYNVGERPTVILYAFINRHAHQTQQKPGTFNLPTSYQSWVWEGEANINWSMVTCHGSIRSELP